MPSTTTYERGQVVVVDVPLSGGSGSKLRPALVISTETFPGRPDSHKTATIGPETAKAAPTRHG